MSREQTEFILEIRYQPNAKVLDHRGKWAEQIGAHMKLAHWVIVENRLDIFDAEQSCFAFLGFRNAGYKAVNPPTKNFFEDQCLKFLKLVMSFDGFQNPLAVDRIGVRARFLKPFEGSIKELVDRYRRKYYRLTSDAEVALSGELIDVGGALNFTDKYGNFNTHSGPMPIEQSKAFFRNDKDFPEVGLYFDIDYWLRPVKLMTFEEIAKTVRQFSSESIQKHTRVADLILGEHPNVEPLLTARPEAPSPRRSI